MIKSLRSRPGFTIVELLVVIVVIGILAAISIVSYSGIAQRATAARLQSDLNSNSKLLELYKVEHDEYPRTIDSGTNCPDSPTVDNKYCLKVSEDDDTLTYEGDGGTGGGAGDTYTLTITDDDTNTSYEIVPGGVAVAVGSGGGVSPTSTFIKAVGAFGNEYGESVITTSDGGYVVVGQTDSYSPTEDYEALIIKYNSSGEQLWAKTWNEGGYAYGMSVTELTDHSYVMTGQGGAGMFLAKFSSAGALLWDKLWDGPAGEYGDDITATSDGGFVVVGQTTSFGAGDVDAFIAKYTSDGTLSWDRTWGDTGGDTADSVVQINDGSIVVACWTTNFGVDGNGTAILKFNLDGSLVWEKLWDAFPVSIAKISDGGFVIAGSSSEPADENYNVYISKFDSDGDVSWTKYWGSGIGSEEPNSIIQASNGDLLVVGYTRSFGNGNYESFIARFSSNGSLIWDKIFGSSNEDQGRSISELSDDSLIMLGWTYGFGAGGPEMFVAKYASDGAMNYCPSPKCQDINASSSSATRTTSSISGTINDPAASISSNVGSVDSVSLTTTVITPSEPYPDPTITFSADELRVLYPGEDQIVCKDWDVPDGNQIFGFYVDLETEGGYDFFTVSIDGTQRFKNSDVLNNEYIDLTSYPGTHIRACMETDSSTQSGFGGEVTGIYYK